MFQEGFGVLFEEDVAAAHGGENEDEDEDEEENEVARFARHRVQARSYISERRAGRARMDLISWKRPAEEGGGSACSWAQVR